MDYWRLRYLDSSSRRRAIRNIKRLRTSLEETIPQKTAHGTLVLGTFNIRNFDDNRFGNGPRLDESFFYLAEIIAAFDAMAVQELNRDTRPLERLMDILGHEWDYIVTDITEGRSGNTERLGFIFNKEKVSFKGIAGELVLPDKDLISNVTKRYQFSRTPFACSFQSGWLKFMFATVHIYYGKQSKSSNEYKRRVKEIQAVAKAYAKRAKADDYNYVLVGDFNIDKLNDPTGDALEGAGFEIFRNKKGSNRTQNKFYDQISFMVREGELRLADSENAHGVYDAFTTVFRDEDFDDYDSEVRATLTAKIRRTRKELERWKAKSPSQRRTTKIKSLKKDIEKTTGIRSKKASRREYYEREWRTYQISDHLPLWVELDVDFTDDYLNRLRSK